MSALSRRRFLYVGGGVALGAAAVWAGLRLTDDGDDYAAANDRLAAFFSDPQGARRLGEAYVADSGLDAAGLAAAVAPAGEDPRQWFASVSDETFAVHLRAAVDSDFDRGSVVDVDGWQLATTEASACALFAVT